MLTDFWKYILILSVMIAKHFKQVGTEVTKVECSKIPDFEHFAGKLVHWYQVTLHWWV